jgi:hypothetical protein
MDDLLNRFQRLRQTKKRTMLWFDPFSSKDDLVIHGHTRPFAGHSLPLLASRRRCSPVVAVARQKKCWKTFDTFEMAAPRCATGKHLTG